MEKIITQTLDSNTFAAMRQLAEIVYNSGAYEAAGLVVKTRAISGSRVVDVPDPAATISKIQLTMLRAIESGIPPLIGLYNIVWYGDRPCVWGDIALAMVQKHPAYAGHDESFDESTMTAYCVIWRGDKKHKGHFSWDDAVKAKISRSEFYLKYPKRMLRMRARALAIRDGFADALSGLSIADEMQHVTDAPEAAGQAFGGVREDQDAFTRAAMADAPAPDGKVDFGVLAQKATDFLPPPKDESEAQDDLDSSVPEKPKKVRKPRKKKEVAEDQQHAQIARVVEDVGDSERQREPEDDIDDIYARIAAAEKRQQDRVSSAVADPEEESGEDDQLSMMGLAV